MHVQLAENLGRIQQVLVVVDPVDRKNSKLALHMAHPDREGGRGRAGEPAERGRDVLLRIEGEERQV